MFVGVRRNFRTLVCEKKPYILIGVYLEINALDRVPPMRRSLAPEIIGRREDAFPRRTEKVFTRSRKSAVSENV